LQLPFALTLMRMLRILRLVRVMRIVRLVRYMSELQALIVSVMGSLKALVSTMFMLVLIMYIVGIYFTQIAAQTRADCLASMSSCTEEQIESLESFYGSVALTMYGLFQTATGGIDWGDMAEPLIVMVSPLMGGMFSLYIAFTSLAVMNIVTGIFVDSALQRSHQYSDMCMISQLRQLFDEIDIHHDGEISWEDLQSNLTNEKLLTLFKDIDIDPSEAEGLFGLLDRNHNGQIELEDFLSGCLRLRGNAKAFDLQLVMRELVEHRRYLQNLIDAQQAHGLEPPMPGKEATLALE